MWTCDCAAACWLPADSLVHRCQTVQPQPCFHAHPHAHTCTHMHNFHTYRLFDVDRVCLFDTRLDGLATPAPLSAFVSLQVKREGELCATITAALCHTHIYIAYV